jgi:serine/threonine protein kinase
LADFGLSKYYGYDPSRKSEEESDSDDRKEGEEGKKEGKSYMQVVGSPDYIAVEVLRREKCDVCADWWSFGVILYEMLAGTLPFDAEEVDDIFRNILNYK